MKTALPIALLSCVLLVSCGAGVELGKVPCGDAGCLYAVGDSNDPVLEMALTAAASEGGLCPAAMSGALSLHTDTFSSAASAAWPANQGYAGDFNGDWYTDSSVALFYNPRWNGSSVGLPTMTGFVKFLSVWPAAGSRFEATANVRTGLTAAASDTTLVVYFFNASNTLLGIATSSTVGGQSSMRLVIDAAIPTGTTRVAVVPTAYIALEESGSVYYEDLRADYITSSWRTAQTVASESFATAGDAAYDAKHPSGWVEYLGDYFVNENYQHLTVWNPTWSGGAALSGTATLSKAFDISAAPAGARLSVSVFGASTFSDAASWADVAVTFDSGTTTVASAQLKGDNYLTLMVDEAAIPAGALVANVHLRTSFGPSEASSFYMDDVSLAIVAGGGDPSAAADRDSDGIANVCDNCPSVANATQTDANKDGFGDACVSTSVVVGAGSTIGAGAVIGSNVVLKPGVKIGNNVTIGNNTVIEDNAVIGDNTVIGSNVTIKKNAVIGASVTIANNTVVEESAKVGDGSKVGTSVTLKKSSVLGTNVTIGDFTVIEEAAKLGDGSTIGSRVTVKKNSVLGTNVKVGDSTVIEEAVTIGNNSTLGTRVTVKKNAKLGANVTVRDSYVVAEGRVVADNTTL